MNHDPSRLPIKHWFVTATSAGVMGFCHLAATGYGPFDLPPALCLFGIVLLWGVLYRGLVTHRSTISVGLYAAWIGFWYYIVTIHWVGSALIFGRDDWVAKLLAGAGSFGCTALFFPWWSLAAIAGRWLTAQWAVLGPFGFAVCWSVADVLLGDFVYGIPLGSMSAAVLDTPMDGLLTSIGTHGVSFLIVWLGCSLGTLKVRPALAAATVTCAVAVLPASLTVSPREPTKDVSVATVQIGDMRYLTTDMNDAATLIVARAKAALDLGADLVVFPETTLLGSPEGAGVLEALQGALGETQAILIGGRRVITGPLSASGERSADIFNTVYLVTQTSSAPIYDKTHLAIFGEYMPWIFGVMGLNVVGGGSGLAAGEGLGVQRLRSHPPFLLTICYESLMSGPMQRARGDAEWILNVSNEFLFGTTIGAAIIQRYNRMRSLELGLPAVRAVMTGFSGHIDAKGNVLSQEPLSKSSIAVIKVPENQPTLFAVFGGWPLLGIQIFGIVAILLITLGVKEAQNGRTRVNCP